MRQKIKIMKHKQQPSDEEIQSYMNFDRLLENRKTVANSSRINTILKWSVSVTTLVLVVSWFYFQREAGRPVVKQDTPVQQDIPEIPSKITPIDSGADKSISEEKISEKSVAEDILQGEVPANTPEKSDLQQKAEPEIKGDGYFQAEPLMGYPDLYEYFNANLVYPADALKDSIQGVQTVSFVINTKGKPEQIQVIKSLGQPFEKECLRLIENMPEWRPATLNGKPVASKISIPLTFQIQKIKSN